MEEKNMRAEHKQEISVAEFFSKVFTLRGWLAFALAAVLSLVLCFSLLFFVVSPKNAKSYYEYELTFPGMEDERYPDSVKFYYLDALSADNLNAVKAMDESFATLNVEKMLADGDITLEREAKTTNALTAQTVEYKYTMTVARKYFKDGVAADKFLRLVAETPKRHVAQSVKADEMFNYATLYEGADTYYAQINVLTEHVDALIKEYEALEEGYGVTYRVNGGKTFADYSNEVEKVRVSANKKIADISVTRDVPEAFVSKAQAYVDNLWKQYLANYQLIVEYNNSFPTSDNELYAETVIPLVKKNASIEAELKTLAVRTENGTGITDDTWTADVTANADYQKQIEALKGEVDLITKTFTDTITTVYNNETVVGFATVKAQSDGDIGLAITAIISVVVGAVVGFVAAIIVSSVSQKQKTVEEESK